MCSSAKDTKKLGFRIDGREYEIAGRKVKANSFELEVTRLSDQFVTDLAICGNPGPAEGQVAFVLANYNITGDAEVCRAILYEYGAWDDEQLEDHQENLRRMVWLIGCEIAKGRHNEMDGFLHFEGGKPIMPDLMRYQRGGEDIDPSKPVHMIECGCCEEYHREDFFGDCRDDSQRFMDHDRLDGEPEYICANQNEWISMARNGEGETRCSRPGWFSPIPSAARVSEYQPASGCPTHENRFSTRRTAADAAA